MFYKVRTKKVYMKIVEQVQELIKENKLKPGDKLPSEQVLAEEFGASRPSVREALSALEILGITESKGGKGNYIKSNLNASSIDEQLFKELEGEESPFEVLEARKLIEREIVGLAAQRASNKEIANIQSSLNKMKGAITSIPEMMKFDREFHINIAKAAHNSLLLSIMINLDSLVKEKLWTNLKEKSWQISGHTQKYIEEHDEILCAIKNKDSVRAREIMYEHLAGVERDFLNE